MDTDGPAADRRQLVEEFGLLYEQMGGTRMAGRVSGWLLLCDPPVQSLTQIAEALGVSKAAVSGAARELTQIGVAERVGEPGQRGDSYRARAGKMDGMLHLDHVQTLRGLLDRAIATVADEDPPQPNHAMMRDLRDFAAFLEGEIPGLHERWQAQRAKGTATRAGRPDNETPPTAGGST